MEGANEKKQKTRNAIGKENRRRKNMQKQLMTNALSYKCLAYL